MDASKLTRGELIAAVSAAALFLLMFFGWFGVPDSINGIDTGFAQEFAEQAGVDTSFNAWQAFDIIDLILLVTIVVAIGVAAMAASGSASALPVAGSAVVTGLGLLSTVLVLYRVISPPGDAGREFWLFLGLIACAGIAAGGWMAMQEEGTTFQGTADQARDRVSGGGTPPPPPAGGPPSPPPPPAQ